MPPRFKLALLKQRSSVLSILLFLICIKLYWDRVRLEYELDSYVCISEREEPQSGGVKPHTHVFDLKQNLEPRELYSHIECRESARFYTSVTICTHNFEDDVHVSGSILRGGVWESEILRLFTSYIVKHPDCLVLDIGAQIGQYTLFAAKLGARVISVEPYYPNLLRLHKAAHMEKLHDQITLLANAIADNRNQIKLLQAVKSNIGGQSLLENSHKVIKNEANDSRFFFNNKYLVETILFDDLLSFVPQKLLSERARVVIKIDIEGFEPFAFQHARNLFAKLNVELIFMEWGVMNRNKGQLKRGILQMINFLYANQLRPYVYDQAGSMQLLDRRKWSEWPWDIFWTKQGVMNDNI